MMLTLICRLSDKVTETTGADQTFVFPHFVCKWLWHSMTISISQTSYTKVGLPQSEHFKRMKTEGTIYI